MKKHPTLTSIIIGFFRTALLLVLLVSIIISTASVFLRSSIFSKELFIQQITSDQYISEVTEFIDRTIKRKCMAYKLPYDEFRPIITDIRIRDIAERYANNLYESLINGTPMEDIEYPSDDIFKYLKDYFQNKRIIASDDDIQFFAADIAHDITVNIVAINESYGGVNLIKPLSDYFFNNSFLRTIAAYSDLLVVACAFLTIITWILCSPDFKSGLFNVASIYWLAGLFMFVPVMYFKNHNVLSNVTIGNTPVKSLINVLAPPIIDSLTTATMTVFITASVIMLYTIVVYIVSYILNRKKVNEDIREDYTEGYSIEEAAPCETQENVRVRLYFPELNPKNDTAEDTDTVDEITTDDVTELIVDTDHSDTAKDIDTVDEITTDDVTELIVDTDHSDTAKDIDTVDEITTGDVPKLIVDTDHNDKAKDIDTVDEITTDDVPELIVDTDHSDTAKDIDTVDEITTDDVAELIDSIDNSDSVEDNNTVIDNTSDDIMKIIADVESKLNY